MDDVLDVESLLLAVESVPVVLVAVLVLLSVLRPSDESAEAIAAASGLTLSWFDEESDASGVDIRLLPEFWLFAW
ncbi:hypothetical protein C7402_11343 [Paraburkholderia unamae]|uniref:Uncharacterized protein n=1 Tax=Paraburkholderia unamae TaxID=219649 RepID=A0ABX5KKC5_9BURK|nr:hypothetical protein C7402_11343 [Paraburkholderia unamae]RAR65165.1 hypothetical protein C7401_104281 [Paraburkholderia unamae]